MLNYIAAYPNPYADKFNDEIILAPQDASIASYVIMEMKELEAIENITIEKVEIIEDQDEMDINQHMVNINYKKKDMTSIEIPKAKYINDGRYGEVVFTIKVETNLNCKRIVKRILIPLKYEGYYYSAGKRMKDIWQIVDEATYSQRGKITLKSRMPVIIYQNKQRQMTDVEGHIHTAPSYSYALNGKPRKGGGARAGRKPKAKFINPLMIYSAKMGYFNTLEFFGMQGIVKIASSYDASELESMYIFQVDQIYVKVYKALFEKYDLVKSFVCMTINLKSPRDFPVSYESLDDRVYWTCRIGTVGAAKSKQIMSFYEKGMTNLLMIERLMNTVTQKSLRLPEHYKQNIYYIMYWMITNFDDLRRYNNTDMRSKRIRRNEAIVNSSLGHKLSDNVIKLIERKGRSKMNTMETLLEIFNFPSDIVVSGMRNLNDMIKTDDIVNDMDFLEDLAFTNKGPNSLGDGNSKMIAVKYRYLDPSMVGVLDLNVSSNSDIGMSGSFVPFVKLYDGFFFTPEHQPCQNRYLFEKALQDEESDVFPKDPDECGELHRIPMPIDSFDKYLSYLEHGDRFKELLQPEKIEIIEKSPEELERRSRKQQEALAGLPQTEASEIHVQEVDLNDPEFTGTQSVDEPIEGRGADGPGKSESSREPVVLSEFEI